MPLTNQRTARGIATNCEYDLIVAATGFNNTIPFLPKSLVRIENDVVKVYVRRLPAVKNLYIIGWAQTRNGFGAVLTPIAKLYAEMIVLQDEMELPIGYVLKWRGLKVPIWIAHRALPLLKRRARIIVETEGRPPFDASAYEHDGEQTPVAASG